jgi:hypothetical protein
MQYQQHVSSSTPFVDDATSPDNNSVFMHSCKFCVVILFYTNLCLQLISTRACTQIVNATTRTRHLMDDPITGRHRLRSVLDRCQLRQRVWRRLEHRYRLLAMWWPGAARGIQNRLSAICRLQHRRAFRVNMAVVVVYRKRAAHPSYHRCRSCCSRQRTPRINCQVALADRR